MLTFIVNFRLVSPQLRTEMNARQRWTITLVLVSPRDEATIDYPFHFPNS